MYNYPDEISSNIGTITFSKISSNQTEINYNYVLVKKTDFIRDFGFQPIGFQIKSLIAQAMQNGSGSSIDLFTSGPNTLYATVTFGTSEVSNIDIKIFYRNSGGSYQIANNFSFRCRYGNINEYDEIYLFFVTNNETIFHAVCVIYWANGSYGNNTFCTPKEERAAQFEDATKNFVLNLAPTYNWTAWDQIAGNSGQYRCQLSKLTDTALEDISPQVGQTSAIFGRLSTRSSIWSIIQNAQLGEEKTVMWSGRNWCTMTMAAGSVSGNYALTFKFYNPNMSATPFYTYTTYIVYSPSSPGVNTDSNLLLAFAYDNVVQAAVFLPVTYSAGGLAEGYSWGVSSQNMPSTDQMLYLYLWLMESGAGAPEYPYDTGTTDDGGNPGGPQPGDHMPHPGVPTLSATSSKMFTVYCPTDEQLEDIAEYLWSDNVITNIRKYFNNFSDNIIALYVLPHQPANLPTKNFTVGNLQSETITGVKYVTSRFVDIDMGSVTVKTTYDSYLDFSPFTRFEIYLPGVGMQMLSADDIMCPTDPDTGTLKPVEESTISVKYTLDLMTGLLVAFVFVNGEMRYQFPGKVGYSIPITGENYTRMVTGAISAIAGLVGAAATGGLTAPLAAGGVAAAVSGTVNAMKPDIHRSGNLSGDVSMMSNESPYLIYHRPNKPLLENQARYTGFPSYKSGALSEFSGLTQVIDAHIEGISCTEAERADILNLLKGGVIL